MGRLSIVACCLAVAGGCTSFSSADPPAGAPDAATDVHAPIPVTVSDAGRTDASASAFCGSAPSALFCDDFEANDLATRWPVQELNLGLADIVDGTTKGRPGKVLRFVASKNGTSGGENNLRLRRQLGAVIALRVAYDLRMDDWTGATGLSTFGAGNAVHGGLSSWLTISGTYKSLAFLAYAGDGQFNGYLGVDKGLVAPVNRWEHYEVVVVPGPMTRFELWVDMPPVKLAADSRAVAFPPGRDFMPTIVEIGFTRSNDAPMPPIVAYYDNVIVTAAR